jgi:hypothetical protein
MDEHDTDLTASLESFLAMMDRIDPLPTQPTDVDGQDGLELFECACDDCMSAMEGPWLSNKSY